MTPSTKTVRRHKDIWFYDNVAPRLIHLFLPAIPSDPCTMSSSATSFVIILYTPVGKPHQQLEMSASPFLQTKCRERSHNNTTPLIAGSGFSRPLLTEPVYEWRSLSPRSHHRSAGMVAGERATGLDTHQNPPAPPSLSSWRIRSSTRGRFLGEMLRARKIY